MEAEALLTPFSAKMGCLRSSLPSKRRLVGMRFLSPLRSYRSNSLDLSRIHAAGREVGAQQILSQAEE